MRHFIARWFWGRTGGMRHAMLSWPLALAVVAVLNAGGAWFAGALTFNNAPEVYYPVGRNPTPAHSPHQSVPDACIVCRTLADHLRT